MSEASAWYRGGLRFECTQCGVCCSGSPGYVWIDDDETAAMAKRLDLSFDEFCERYTRLVDGRRSLQELPERGYDCILLDEKTRGCTVYEDRPTQCRTWPFWESTIATPRSWKETCRECPGAGVGTLYTLDQIAKRVASKPGV